MAQVEQAGGHSSCDGQLKSGLDIEIKEHDQRTQVGLSLLKWHPIRRKVGISIRIELLEHRPVGSDYRSLSTGLTAPLLRRIGY